MESDASTSRVMVLPVNVLIKIWMVVVVIHVQYNFIEDMRLTGPITRY